MKDLPVVPGETSELLILDVSDRADDGDGRKVLVRRVQRLRDRVGTTGAARDVGARSLEVRVEHEDPVLGFRESEEVAPQHLRNLAFRRHVMVRDHGVQAVERVHHSRSEVDEPDERRPPALQLRHDRLIELLDERDFVRDARPVEGLRGDRSARDPIRVDVRHDSDEGRCAHALRDLLGDRIHRPIHRTTRA